MRKALDFYISGSMSVIDGEGDNNDGEEGPRGGFTFLTKNSLATKIPPPPQNPPFDLWVSAMVSVNTQLIKDKAPARIS